MNTIYIKTLKNIDHSVLCVADGQKYYYNAQFNKRIPYSSGQQMKKSLIASFCEFSNIMPSQTTFVFDVDKQNKLNEGEVYGTCDPLDLDQLIGGWMKAVKGGLERTITRRSPLSVSAMIPLHPLLGGIDGSEKSTYNRSESPNNKVIVRGVDGTELSETEIKEVLNIKGNTDRNLNSKWLNPSDKVSGLFVSDLAIDLRRLFSIRLSEISPEINNSDAVENLKKQGWIESENVFGNCLVAPKDIRDKAIKALAKAIIDWRIASNQSRNFSLMATLAISISDNANSIGNSIRAKLSDEESNKAYPIIDNNVPGVETYISPQACGYINVKDDDVYALMKAEEKIIELMSNFDYVNQIK